MQITLLLGAPGSGKGTASARLVARLGLRHVSSGALLRDAVSGGTVAGREAADHMARGELVPDALIGRIITGLLLAGGPGVNWLLDGFPRTVAQAQLLERVAAEAGGRVSRALFLDVPEEILVDRLAGRRVCPGCDAAYHVQTLPPRVPDCCDRCGRALITRPDDDEATVRTRLAVYRSLTAPVVAWYAAKGLLTVVDGVGTADAVSEQLMRVLQP